MILLHPGSPLFLDGNSATFVAAIMTWTILCFFGIRVNKGKRLPQPESNNFMQTLLLMICNRATEILDNVQEEIITSLETKNKKILSKAIAESDKKNNPYKDEMMVLANSLQFKTVNFYNTYLEQNMRVKSLHNKVVKNSIEFFSSFFYSFLFCVFILSVDCLGRTDMQWLINVVSLTAIVSWVYWILIWGHYCLSIKTRKEIVNSVSYKFNIWTCILIFMVMLASIGLINLIDLDEKSMNYVYIGGIIITGIFAMIKYAQRERSVFTHYFNLVHFFLVVSFLSGLCWLQYDVFTNNIYFSANCAKVLSVLFIIFSGLIFPLIIPILRLNWEIYNTNKKLEKAKKIYVKESQKINNELNGYFENLNKIKVLDFVKTK